MPGFLDQTFLLKETHILYGVFIIVTPFKFPKVRIS